jgi:hypothetical protein
MKKVVVAVSLFASGLSVGVLSQRRDSAAIAQGAASVAPTAMACGDVNNSGQVDLSDAIAILQLLFTGERSQLDCRGGPVPSTGQTECYDAVGNAVQCASPDWLGQDGLSQTGCPNVGRIVDNGDGTLIDRCTGLVWEREAPATPYAWEQAIKRCNELELAGYDDWRLPNVHELHSIVNYGMEMSHTSQFLGPSQEWFWTSTTSLQNKEAAFSVRFGDFYTRGIDDGQGPVSVGKKIQPLTRVRAVRGP